MYKLPILNIIIEAFWYPWKYKYQMFNALALPVALVVIISAAWSELGASNQIINWTLYPLYFLAMSFFSISCHRFILIGVGNKNTQSYFLIMKRILIFSLLGFLVYFLAGIPFWIILTMAMKLLADGDLVSSSHSFAADNFSWVKLFLMVPFGYLVGRFSLVLPARAIDVRTNIMWSWEVTKNNGIRMLILIGVVPWITSVLLDLLWRENATMFEYVFISILGYLAVAVEIFILSLAFKEFKRIETTESESNN